MRRELRRRRDAGPSREELAGTPNLPHTLETAAGSGWSQWRGPQRDGHSLETGLLDRWPAEGPPLAWQANNLGSGYSSVVVANGRVFTMGTRNGAEQLIAVDAALDKQTGRPLWTTPLPGDAGDRGKEGAGYSSIVVSTVGGVRQYVQLVGKGLIGVAADSGRLLWGYNRIANDTANIPTPITRGNYVFCSTGYQTGAALLQVSGAGGQVSAEEVYFLDHTQLQNHHGGMLLVGDYVYCDHGHNKEFPVCIELATGRTVWGPERGPGGGSAAVAYADGHLYFRYEDGIMALTEGTPEGYNLKGQFRIASRHDKSWPHPVIVNGRLYLRDQHQLHCYDIRKS